MRRGLIGDGSLFFSVLLNSELIRRGLNRGNTVFNDRASFNESPRYYVVTQITIGC